MLKSILPKFYALFLERAIFFLRTDFIGKRNVITQVLGNLSEGGTGWGDSPRGMWVRVARSASSLGGGLAGREFSALNCTQKGTG